MKSSSAGPASRRAKTTPPKTARRPRTGFRQRFDQLEKERTVLIGRVAALAATARAHDGYKRALTLLNVTFRKSSLAQRAAVLQAAAWLIDVLERLAPTI